MERHDGDTVEGLMDLVERILRQHPLPAKPGIGLQLKDPQA